MRFFFSKTCSPIQTNDQQRVPNQLQPVLQRKSLKQERTGHQAAVRIPNCNLLRARHQKAKTQRQVAVHMPLPPHSAGALAPENTEASSSPHASPTHSAGALAPENTEASSSPHASPTHSAGALAPENTEASSSPHASPTHSAGALAPENTEASSSPNASPTHSAGALAPENITKSDVNSTGCDKNGSPVSHADADPLEVTGVEGSSNVDGNMTGVADSAINEEAVSGDEAVNDKSNEDNTDGVDADTEALMVRQGAAVQLLKLKDLSHLMICELEKHSSSQDANEDAVLDLTTEQQQPQGQQDDNHPNMPLDLSGENSKNVLQTDSPNDEAAVKSGSEDKPNRNGDIGSDTEVENGSKEDLPGSKKDVPDSDNLKELIKQEKKITQRKGKKGRKRKIIQGSDDEDFERPHIPDAIVEDEAEDDVYLSLKVPSVELFDGAVVGEVSLACDLKNLSTEELRKEVKRLRKELNKTGDDFIAAHKQCTRYRDKYAEIAIRHAEISQHIHIREALKVSGTLNRPLTEEEEAKVDGLKLRSGRKLQVKRPKTDEQIQDENF